ncbi:MAG: enoyl-CoA hydratase-related protein [Caulobacter sp.]|jgi:methylglutaconyl-CoA hydratase|nr:enoyl-CoA hydratase-related protein [Caulobacter sp.]
MNNPIADPLVENIDTDALSDLVVIEATPDGVATVTINRPEKKNAFNAEVIAALHQAFETLKDADGVRLVFLTGAGGAFSAGADLEWMRSAADWSESDNRDDAMGLASMLSALHRLPQLTVALIDGPAFGGGAGLAAACDLAIATERSTFAFSEVKLGLTPATISPYVIQAIGPRNAKVLFATGRVFGATDALKWGLVQEVVADPAAFTVIRETLGAAMMACAPGAVADAKRLVDDVEGRVIDHVLIEETARRIAARRVSDEGQEGVRAFLDKRKPGWAE